MTALDRPSIVVSIPVTIRIGTQADLPKLEWYGQYAHHRNLFRRAFQEQQTGRRLMLIADSNSFPIGRVFIHFVRQDHENRWAYLYSLRVMEMFRGYGIGTCLIQEAESIILDRRFQWSTIAAAKENRAALRLYERLGYEVFAEDAGNWSYTDHNGMTRQVHEPCWLLRKQIHLR
jgi:ribosomal protein S18 acetylase RimI-like enzyme